MGRGRRGGIGARGRDVTGGERRLIVSLARPAGEAAVPLFGGVRHPEFTKPVGTGPVWSYRSNWSGPVPVWAGTKPAQIQNLKLNSKKWKILKKLLNILQGATNLMVSNFSKIRSFSIVCGDLKLKKNVHTKVYKYNVKVVQKRVREFI